MNDPSEGALKGLGIFSILRAATKLKFFLLSATFILLTDNVFLTLHQPGIFELSCDHEMLVKSNLIVNIILIFVLYSFLTSVILPVLALVLDEFYIVTIRRIYILLALYFDKKFDVGESQTYKSSGYVSAGKVRYEAHKTKEKYFLDLYREYEEKRADLMECAMFSFYCASMLCWNYYLGKNKENSISVVLARYFGPEYYVWLAIVGLFGIFFYRFFRAGNADWIYCPIVYEKANEEKRKSSKLEGRK